MRDFFFLIILFYTSHLCAQKPLTPLQAAPFLTVTARPGNDIPSVLEFYGLADHECNITQFFKLNKLKDGDYRMKSGQTYKLPIQLMTYDGKSIRSTLGITAWETATLIKEYNEDATERGVRSDKFTQSKQLWVPWHALNCEEKKKGKSEIPVVEGKVPSSTGGKPTVAVSNFGGEPMTGGSRRSFPIFGNQHAYTPLISSRLKGKVFYLISGHGGPDPGARGKRAGETLCEDEYAYDVTLRLLKVLLSHGATAYMIVRDPNDGIRNENYLKCDKDEEVWGKKVIPINQKERLGQRTDIINALCEQHKKKGQTDQTVIEIHIDSRSVATETDVFFYYRAGSEASMDLALHIHQVFMDKYKEKRGPTRRYMGNVSARDLYTLRETTTRKAVYVELANIRNDWDQQRLVLSNNRQALANWIGEAMLKR